MVIRIFNAYFPSRTLLLAFSEACVVVFAFTMSCVVLMGRDADIFLNYDGGFANIAPHNGRVCFMHVLRRPL